MRNVEPFYMVFAIITAVLMSMLFRISRHQKTWLNSRDLPNRDDLPLILAWTRYYARHSMRTQLQTVIDWCPVKCRVSESRRHILNADAVVFHGGKMHHLDVPPVRYPSQLFVDYNQEAPTRTDLFSEYRMMPSGFFNASVNYERSATFYDPYLVVEPRANASAIFHYNNPNPPSVSRGQIQAAVAKKAFPILWVVSNCDTVSKREEYANELKKFVPVTMVGRCAGGTKVPTEDIQFDKYFFYLSFENSVCPDYYSEKINHIKDFIVPIVLRRKVVGDALPRNFFIAADDFASPKDLANHLLNLTRNREMYMEHFDWMQDHYINPTIRPGICRMCEFLHERRAGNIAHSHRFTFDHHARLDNHQCLPGYASTLL